MALFGSKKKKPPPPVRPTPVDWARNPRGQFYKFVTFEPEKAGLTGGGVYVIWHSGVQPHWVYVGYSNDIAADLDTLADNDELMSYNSRGGLFVTWAPIKPEYRPGVVRFLTESMDPLVENPKAAVIADEPVPVLVPGAKAA